MKLNISKKIRGSFLVLIAVMILNGVYTLVTLRNSTYVLEMLSSEVDIALTTLAEFKSLVKDSKTYATNWVYIGTYENDKNKLRNIHSEQYESQRVAIEELMTEMKDSTLVDELDGVLTDFQSVLAYQKEVMMTLGTFSDYEDPMNVFIVEDLVENQIVPQTDQILQRLDGVIAIKKAQSDQLQQEMVASFGDLQNTILVLAIIAMVAALLLSTWLAKNIIKPLKVIEEKIGCMQQGRMPGQITQISKDEMGSISSGINALIASFKSSSEFANEMGRGNLSAEFKALSDDDVLGNALLTMRDNLKDVIDETNNVVRLAGDEGVLDARIDTSAKENAWRLLSESINSLLASVARPIIEVNEIVNAIADGDFTQRYTGQSKGAFLALTDGLNKAMTTLSTLLLEISDNAKTIDEFSNEMLNASEEMSTNTSEIASAVAQMSTGAQSQVQKVDESSNLSENILKSSKDMGIRSEEINNAAKSGVDSSSKGTNMVSNVVESMRNITTYTGMTNESIKVLTDRSNEITRVLGVISDIAAQTNLLALNAAIEAAQAGDAGRGFAVVAEEIRKLAEDSKRSAQEIEKLVTDVQNDTKSAASVMEQMNKSVQIGEEASNQAFASFEEISGSSNTTLSLSEEILSSTQNQVNDINTVVNITESIVVIAEQTAAGTEEVASSAAELSSGMKNYTVRSKRLTEIAENLKDSVAKFKLDEQLTLSEEIGDTHIDDLLMESGSAVE